MKTIALITFFLTAISFGFGQNTIDTSGCQNDYDYNTLASHFQTPLKGDLYINDGYIKGAKYYPDKWLPSRITLNNNQIIKNKILGYNVGYFGLY